MRASSDCDLTELYGARFAPDQLRAKQKLWKILCSRVLQRHIAPNSIVIDLGAGFCEFINNIECRTKFAVDIAPHTAEFAGPAVVVKPSLSAFDENSADVIFCSNFFEHVKTKSEVVEILLDVRRVLRGQGRLIIIQPNIYYAYREYWDYFDHYLPFSHRTMDELLRSMGFRVIELIPNLLPYSTRTRLIKLPFLLHVYLSLPVFRFFLGKQMFILAEKNEQ